jgi:hypothetical protein
MEYLNEPSQEVKEALSNPRYQEPKGAYVMFEAQKNEVQDDGTTKIVMRNIVLVAEHRPTGVRNKIAYYLRKGAKLLGYGNFPSHDHPRADRRFHYGLFNGPNGQPNEFDSLLAEVKMLGKGGSVQDLVRERDALQAKLAAYEQKQKAESKTVSSEVKGEAKARN